MNFRKDILKVKNIKKTISSSLHPPFPISSWDWLEIYQVVSVSDGLLVVALEGKTESIVQKQLSLFRLVFHDAQLDRGDQEHGMSSELAVTSGAWLQFPTQRRKPLLPQILPRFSQAGRLLYSYSGHMTKLGDEGRGKA